jgi:hypothetical protein
MSEVLSNWGDSALFRTPLFEQICPRDLEGIVTKPKFGPYAPLKLHGTVSVHSPFD